MDYLPLLIPVLAILLTTVGLFGVMLANFSSCPKRCRWGRWVYLFVFLFVAGCCLTMALTWPRGVLPNCFAMGALFLAMLWHPQPVEQGE